MSEKQNYEGLETALEFSSVLLELFQDIPRCRTFEKAAKSIFDACKKFTGARSGYVALLSENGEENEVLFLDSGGMNCDVDPDLPMPIRGLREVAYKTKDVVYDNQFADSRWMKYMPPGHVRLDNVLFAPLNVEKNTVGLIGLANKPGGFRDQDVKITKMLGNLAAIALSHASAREKLQKRGERYQSILKTAMDGFLMADSEGRLLEVNDSYCSMSGYSREELLGMQITDLDIVENSHSVSEHIKKVIKTGADRFESMHRRKDGEIFAVDINVQKRPDDERRFVCFIRDITDRKMSENALRQSERKWRNILVNTPQIGISLNPEAEIIFVNDYFLKLTGWKEREILGKDWFDMFIPAKAREEIRKVFRINMSQKSTLAFLNYENEILDRSGNLINVAWSNVLTKNSSGNIVDVTCLGVDLTERIRAEKKLAESEAYMRSIFRAAPTGIGVVKDRVFEKVNETFCEMLGYVREELIGESAVLVYPSTAEYEKAGQKKYEQIGKKGTGSVETVFKRKDGELIDVLLSSTPIDPEDLSFGVTFTALDISERKRAEKSLRDSHERFITVLDSIDATVYVADMETYEILFMNRHMIRQFGEDFTGRVCWEVFRGGEGPCSFCSNRHLVDDNGNPTGVYTWHDENPVTGKWYINRDRAVTWVDGRLVRLQIASDITEVKKLEERIRDAQKMESIGNLAGGIAHDFNNILFPIIGRSELLIEDLIPGSLEEENAREILNAGKRGRDLVKQILAFSRQSEHQMEPARIQYILKEVLKLSRSIIPSNIEIDEKIQADCGLVQADATQIHQVAMNLVTNAYHAIGNSDGVITMRLEEKQLENPVLSGINLEPGKYVVLSISDTGEGIAPDLVSRIFDPYFTTKEQGKGTGLGLAVVHGIVKEHNGDIKVSSVIGSGTTFQVYLPLMKQSISSKKKDPGEEIKTGSEKILLVDDEPAIVDLEKKILERLGYQVSIHVSSLEALEAFQADPQAFDLVISDMTMPHMTGDKLAGEIKSVRPDLPIIICTGFSEKVSSGTAEKLGIDEILMKPIYKSELAGKVRKVLDKSPG